MKPTKTPNAPRNGAQARTQTNDIDTHIIPPNDAVCQSPILFLDIGLELDACLDAEDEHLAAGRAFYSEWMELQAEADRIGNMAIAHAEAVDKARRERVILERGVV